MPKARYETIYRLIREEISSGKHSSGDFLPSETVYAQKYGCARNTVRRALSMLADEGYVLPRHGRGVQVIYKPESSRPLTDGGKTEGIPETDSLSEKTSVTSIKVFKKITVDSKISLKTGFAVGTEVWYIERTRTVEGKNIIYDTKYIMCSEAPSLTPEIAATI